MLKKSKEKQLNLFYVDDGQEREKKAKEREKRIKENKKLKQN